MSLHNPLLLQNLLHLMLLLHLLLLLLPLIPPHLLFQLNHLLLLNQLLLLQLLYQLLLIGSWITRFGMDLMGEFRDGRAKRFFFNGRVAGHERVLRVDLSAGLFESDRFKFELEGVRLEKSGFWVFQRVCDGESSMRLGSQVVPHRTSVLAWLDLEIAGWTETLVLALWKWNAAGVI